MANTTNVFELRTMLGSRIAVGFDFSAMFQDLTERGDADVAIVSTEEGFSPLGGSRNFFERELGVSFDEEIRPIANWNRFENEEVTLVAIPSRIPTSSLIGILLAPGENCKSYSHYASPYGRKPYRDYYYNVMFESINQACRMWGAKMLAISHLSSSGKFHEDMLICQIETLNHFCQENPQIAPRSLTYCCCCISEEHFKGLEKLNTEGIKSHRPIKIMREQKGFCTLIHLDLDSLATRSQTIT